MAIDPSLDWEWRAGARTDEFEGGVLSQGDMVEYLIQRLHDINLRFSSEEITPILNNYLELDEEFGVELEKLNVWKEFSEKTAASLGWSTTNKKKPKDEQLRFAPAHSGAVQLLPYDDADKDPLQQLDVAVLGGLLLQ